MDKFCLIAILALTGAILGVIAMFLNYKAKFEKDKIILEKHDKEQEKDIKELKKKNGSEQHQINEIKERVEKLEKKGGKHE